MQIWDQNFSDDAQKIAKMAFQIAAQHGNETIDIEHVLLAILDLENESLNRVFSELNVDLFDIRSDVLEVIQSHGKNAKKPIDESNLRVTSRVAKVIENANLDALRLSGGRIAPEHILLGVLSVYGDTAKEQCTYVGKSLLRIGLTAKAVKFALRKI
jgi:ATP-dependent Clp protease ATP-binding subunit ClpB